MKGKYIIGGAGKGKPLSVEGMIHFVNAIKEVNDGINVGTDSVRIKDYMQEKMQNEENIEDVFKECRDQLLKQGEIKTPDNNVFFLKNSTN